MITQAKYLNDKIKDPDIYNGPSILYKYRPLNDDTFDMLENDYLYLCPAYKLDDKSECVTTLDPARLMNVDDGSLKIECVNQIFDFIKPYTNQETNEAVRNMFSAAIDKHGKVDNRLIVEMAPDIQEMYPEVDVPFLVNALANIPEKFTEEMFNKNIAPLLLLGVDARQTTGICSFTEDFAIDKLWDKYAANNSGCCIEYSIDGYESGKDILPVIYENKKEKDILVQLVGSFMGNFIEQMTNGLISADKSHFIRLLLTKSKKWQYQKEWRLIGQAGEKRKAPTINRIIIGKNISISNKEKLESICVKKDILISE